MEAAQPFVVMLENDFVRVVNVNLVAGQTSPRYTPASMPTVRVDLASGKTRYIDEGSSEQIPHAPMREIRVELKQAPDGSPNPLDALKIDPNRYRVDFENDRVRIVRLSFGPREKGLMVSHPPRVLVTLTEVAVKLLFSDGRTDERGAPAGVAGWLEAETLQTENARDETLEVVLVEPKSTRGF